jgi:hypothetical protein
MFLSIVHRYDWNTIKYKSISILFNQSHLIISTSRDNLKANITQSIDYHPSICRNDDTMHGVGRRSGGGVRGSVGGQKLILENMSNNQYGFIELMLNKLKGQFISQREVCSLAW